MRAAAAAGCACIAFPHDYTADNDISGRAQAVIRSLDELTVELVEANPQLTAKGAKITPRRNALA